MAYELQYDLGLLGPLYVQPAHRRKGLAKCCMAALIRKIMLEGRPVYVWVYTANQPSLKLHKDFGFDIVGQSDTYTNVQYFPVGN